ncbi:hypothetical protein JI59_21995 (plasmid) [Novosphingobium pentaromativorans US6-1]|uniref:Beta-lactamase n=1 Tax=Novosphingobium pentaromativorans US6-1 TaxID=1088721 RepID=G6EGC6_9SPHN|nr:hypothetical protein JI59_21995 [Novosphingobium pentaromativorans US6-1]EHJ59815.1 Beta-lactamase [Novosphingobium pentaromativorans US6-1]
MRISAAISSSVHFPAIDLALQTPEIGRLSKSFGSAITWCAKMNLVLGTLFPSKWIAITEFVTKVAGCRRGAWREDEGRSVASEFDTVGLARASLIPEALIQQGILSGAVTLVWKDGDIRDVTVLGERNIERRDPMTRDTLFRVASMSKPITSVAAMMLVEDGLLALDSPIARWLPELADLRVLRNGDGPLDDTVPAQRDLMVEDLLTHRAGFIYGFSASGPIVGAYEDALGNILETLATPDEWLTALGSLPLAFQPGEQFRYSYATDVLGCLVGRVAGMSFRDFLRERLLDPMGMVDTDFYVPAEKLGRLATIYRHDKTIGELAPVPIKAPAAAPALCGGGGGMFSTADDYLRFARMLLNDGELAGQRLLQPETVALMRGNRLSDEQRRVDFLGRPGFWSGQGFGLGLSMITDVQAHAAHGAGSVGAFGWPGAFGTWWQADPQENAILIYLVQNSEPVVPPAQEDGGAAVSPVRAAMQEWQRAIYASFR